MGIKVNDKEVMQMFEEMKDIPQFVMEKTYPYLKSRTPIRSGNARSKTRIENNKSQIGSRYPYADTLDKGWSRQAPKGFTEPSIEKMEDLVADQIRKVGQ